GLMGGRSAGKGEPGRSHGSRHAGRWPGERNDAAATHHRWNAEVKPKWPADPLRTGVRRTPRDATRYEACELQPARSNLRVLRGRSWLGPFPPQFGDDPLMDQRGGPALPPG